MGRALGDELVVHLPRCFISTRWAPLAAHPLLVARHRRAVVPTSSGLVVCWSPTKWRVKRTTMRNATLIVALLVGAGDGAADNPLDDPSRVVLRHRHPRCSRCLSAHGWRSVAPRTCWEPRRACTFTKQVRNVLDGVESSRSSPCWPSSCSWTASAVPLPRRHPVGLRAHRRRHPAVMVHPASLLGRFAGTEAACMDRACVRTASTLWCTTRCSCS